MLTIYLYMNDQPIGVLDSGIGGLTVVKEIIRELPDESIIYIGDSLNTPYGARSTEEIYRFSKRLINFLMGKNVKLIVSACNTIAVSNIHKLRTDYPDIPIVGTVPAIKTAVAVTKNKRIGILSTTRTAQSGYQKDLINTFADGCMVFNHGTDELVPLIEQGKETEDVLQKVLINFKKEHIDTLVLGCTHFPLLREQMQRMLGPDVEILDSGAAIARQIRRILKHNETFTSLGKAKYDFYTTGSEKLMEKIVKKIIDSDINSKIQTVIL